ncbi:MAG: ERAP1-like C-terminal domain-containing protein [Deltaproteobacteria bacterium]|nr:ERAP1-like C-terminal domain-containing protein [Deltaproteobacteria bacterium]
MGWRIGLLSLTLSGLAACASTAPALTSAPPETSEAAPPGPELPDGNARLDDRVTPLGYTLDLAVDPSGTTFSGEATIEVAVREATRTVRLHAEDMTRLEATVRQGERAMPAAVVTGPHGGLELALAEPLAPGTATLTFSYEAPLPEVPIGLYRVRADGRPYAYTQFEPLEARKAFPCFDQPSFKAPFATTLRVPTGMVALSNAPETARETLDGGQTAFRFAPTPPLPTYLVAFAVGDFDVVAAPEGAIPKVPLRVITTKGKGAMAAWTLARTPRILGALTDWFGRPYPFAKLDLVAVPNFGAGAMENAGLVTFRERFLLLDGDAATQDERLDSESIIAHELAHMWFGDLVTMPWWDDIWLNEAFATWMATRVVATVSPDAGARLSALRSTGFVMGLDSLANTRAIRQPIRDGGDVYNAFDGITYVKGRAILQMLESWLGEDAFRQGVRSYLDAHARGTATTADLLAALSAASGKPVEQTVSGFLDQPGVPLLDVALKCATGKVAPATLELSQTRYEALGTAVPAGEPWRVPVCVRYELRGKVLRECFRLDGPEATVTLGAPGCPAWLHPNAQEQGYYRWTMGAEALAGLAGPLRGKLLPEERVALPGHVMALLRAGRLSLADALADIGALASERSPLVVEGVIDALGELDRVAVTDATRPAWQAWVRQLLGPHLERLGKAARASDSPRERLLRPRLVSALADMGGDRTLRAEARAQVEAFLSGRGGVSAEDFEQAASLGTWDGDEALWTLLRQALDRETTPATRVVVIGALGRFEDPALLVRSLELLLDGTLLAQDFRTMTGRIGRTEEAERTGFGWLVQHYDAVVEKLGEKSAPRLPGMAGELCDSADRARVADFFAGADHSPPGTERNLGQVLERIDSCIARRAAWAEPLAAWLVERR